MKEAAMRQVGHIERLQVQLGRLKKGAKPDQHYDPSALHAVPALRLTAKGVIGLVDGRELLDVHHADHAYSRNRGSSGISLNFSPHYEHMRHRFGSHLETGCAGENILVATDQPVPLAALAQGLVIETADGTRVRLTQIQVAHPCLSFSTYALELQGEPAGQAALKETLGFLDGGTRGFYCEWTGEPVVVRPGDRVFLPAD
jgi:hypothetical protein